MDLKDKTIVITGAARGLGRKMAEVIANSGAKLALVDLNEDDLQETAWLCSESGSRVRKYSANVADEAAVEALFAKVHSDLGSVDGLINNAGTNRDALLLKVKDGKVESKMSLADSIPLADVSQTERKFNDRYHRRDAIQDFCFEVRRPTG